MWYNENMKELLNDKKKMMIILSVVAVLGLLLIFSLGEEKPELMPADAEEMNHYDSEAFFLDEKGRICYEDTQWTSLIGVDVSSYQNQVDWKRVAADGVELAMVRLGYRGYSSGTMNLDPYFEENVKGASNADLYVGVYFFSQAVTKEEAMDEARFVLRKIRGMKIDGPIAYDMEYIPGADRINGLTVEEKTELADAFCQVIEENGYRAMIYGNPTWFTEDVNLSALSHRGIWLAHYIDMTRWPYGYWMWQYTDQGIVDGIEGTCDLNIWLQKKIAE